MSAKLSLGGSIWCYLRECTAPDTIYARFDDDICYVADDAIANWRKFREANVAPFLVLGNIVNNAVCSHSHQQAGLIPTSWDTVEKNRFACCVKAAYNALTPAGRPVHDGPAHQEAQSALHVFAS